MITMTVIQLITGAIGSVAFGLLFHMKTKYLPLAAAGGFLSWLVFLFGKNLWGSVFLPALLAGFIADVYAEILARSARNFHFFFRYFRDSVNSRKYPLLLHEQYCRGKSHAGT